MKPMTQKKEVDKRAFGNKYAVILRAVHLLMCKATAIEPHSLKHCRFLGNYLSTPPLPHYANLGLNQFELPETLPDVPRVHKHTCWLKLIRLNSSHWFQQEESGEEGFTMMIEESKSSVVPSPESKTAGTGPRFGHMISALPTYAGPQERILKKCPAVLIQGGVWFPCSGSFPVEGRGIDWGAQGHRPVVPVFVP